MKERPILFCDDMVRAIFDGRKTQTRRIVKPSAYQMKYCRERWHSDATNESTGIAAKINLKQGYDVCPYGEPGDRLWVKETFQHICEKSGASCVRYRADMSALKSWASDGGEGDFVKVEGKADPVVFEGKQPHWKPSIFMPRWASRITLAIESVRVERLQDISEDDAKAEGCYPVTHEDGSVDCGTRKTVYRQLWDSLNGKTYPWASNPWVWVLTFHRVKP